WAPHVWGPFYPIFNSDCSERDSDYPTGCVPFFGLMDYGENVVSTTPPLTQIRTFGKSDLDDGAGEGSVGFWTIEANSGRVPFAGMARRADYLGVTGQLGMGYRFTSGNQQGAISRRGNSPSGSYSLAWWADMFDHGGYTEPSADSRPFMRDLLSG